MLSSDFLYKAFWVSSLLQILFAITNEHFISSCKQKENRAESKKDCVVVSQSRVLNRGDILNRRALIKLSCHDLGHCESHVSQPYMMRSVTLPLSWNIESSTSVIATTLYNTHGWNTYRSLLMGISLKYVEIHQFLFGSLTMYEELE